MVAHYRPLAYSLQETKKFDEFMIMLAVFLAFTNISLDIDFLETRLEAFTEITCYFGFKDNCSKKILLSVSKDIKVCVPLPNMFIDKYQETIFVVCCFTGYWRFPLLSSCS